MHKLIVRTDRRSQFVNITDRVREAAAAMGRRDGVLTVFVPHTTAGITINEGADPDVTADIEAALSRLVPWDGAWRHGEGNSAAHVKASLLGSSVRVLMEHGEVQLGTWQAIYFCEFDGPRTREVWVQ